MRICIAQTKSLKGAIDENIKSHLNIIQRAVAYHADLIVFPELSITNYEPELAEKLATDIEDSIFNPFQDQANKNQITIGVGMPIQSPKGVLISMLLFQPHQERTTYSKQILHTDELPFFTSGNRQEYLKIKDSKIALGICYETLQLEHFLKTHNQHATVYFASVSKPANGVAKAYTHFAAIARKYKTPILMANAVGPADNFIGVGQSAVWDNTGLLVGQLDDNKTGILIYDTQSNQIEKEVF